MRLRAVERSQVYWRLGGVDHALSRGLTARVAMKLAV
jgi:hypothetical protein